MPLRRHSIAINRPSTTGHLLKVSEHAWFFHHILPNEKNHEKKTEPVSGKSANVQTSPSVSGPLFSCRVRHSAQDHIVHDCLGLWQRMKGQTPRKELRLCAGNEARVVHIHACNMNLYETHRFVLRFLTYGCRCRCQCRSGSGREGSCHQFLTRKGRQGVTYFFF